MDFSAYGVKGLFRDDEMLDVTEENEVKGSLEGLEDHSGGDEEASVLESDSKGLFGVDTLAE